jgi:3-deoxy-7-phosphoheptulonate synthase
MIVLIHPLASPEQIETVCRTLSQTGLTTCRWQDSEGTVIGVIGRVAPPLQETLQAQLERISCVKRVTISDSPYSFVSRAWKLERSRISLPAGLTAGGEELLFIAGPCSVESREQIRETAQQVKARGAQMLRGGAFKPRTSPHAFQGLGREGLRYLREAADQTGLPVVTEVMDTRDLEAVEAVADLLQVGSRNMQNYALLKAVSLSRKPVLLKRSMCATVEEWLQAAEYIFCGGNPRVILCERGIRTFETATRNTLDLNAIPLLKRLTHLPVLVDPSHGTGHRDLVIPMSLAAIAAGADGLIVEVHPSPDTALSDGAQSLTLSDFSELISRAAPVAQAVGRRLSSLPAPVGAYEERGISP